MSLILPIFVEAFVKISVAETSSEIAGASLEITFEDAADISFEVVETSFDAVVGASFEVAVAGILSLGVAVETQSEDAVVE